MGGVDTTTRAPPRAFFPSSSSFPLPSPRFSLAHVCLRMNQKRNNHFLYVCDPSPKR